MPAVLLPSQPASVEFNLGCMLIGTYINSMLYAVVMLSVFLYFRGERSKRDPTFVKVAVIINAVMDTIATFGAFATYFYLSVLRWGNFDYEFRTHWAPAMGYIASSVSELVVQTFMARRYFIMSKSYILSGFIGALILLSFGSTVSLAIASLAHELPSHQRPSNLTPFIVAMASTLACDLATTTAMFWTLKKTDTYTRISHHVVSRISAIVIITGTFTCILVLATLITFLAYPMSALTSSFNCYLGRVYTLTMMFTLLYRDMITDDRWIQVDEVTEGSALPTETASEPSLPESTPSAGISVPEMIFARRESLPPGITLKDVEKNDVEQ